MVSEAVSDGKTEKRMSARSIQNRVLALRTELSTLQKERAALLEAFIACGLVNLNVEAMDRLAVLKLQIKNVKKDLFEQECKLADAI